MEDRPEVVASAYLPDRLEKYRILDRYRARSSAIQFNIPEWSGVAREPVYPTRTFLGEMTFSLGGRTFEVHTARAETDDACWVWVPELRAAFIGDLMIGSFPNIGNPWKPTRFTLDWAKTLEEVRARQPDLVLCNGAAVVYEGNEAMAALDANIEVIRNLHDQVVEYINQGMHITEMIHAVEIPDHLRDNPYLRLIYSRPEFFVFNTYRWYHGYFDDNPANLLPRPQKEVNSEIFGLIGDPEKILNRARALFAQGQAQLALQVLDVLIQAESENLDARRLRIELLEKLGSEDYCLMSRNAWVYFIERGWLRADPGRVRCRRCSISSSGTSRGSPAAHAKSGMVAARGANDGLARAPGRLLPLLCQSGRNFSPGAHGGAIPRPRRAGGLLQSRW
jgi:glyoxylase-like metal-dependent hydrolase (beta-lactamase superfamily II)